MAKLGLASPLLLLTSKFLSSDRHKVNQPFLIIIVHTESNTLTNTKYTEMEISYFTKQELRAISADVCQNPYFLILKKSGSSSSSGKEFDALTIRAGKTRKGMKFYWKWSKHR